jgi:RNA polymerase sigma factor (sigma-70 family)
MDVNQKFEEWQTAEGEAKANALEVLFKAAKEYAARLMSKVKGENPPELADDIAADVIVGLDGFRRESRFSTWAGRITLNKWKDHIRNKIADRERFVDPPHVDADAGGEEEGDSEVANKEAVATFRRQHDIQLELWTVEEHIRDKDRAVYDEVFVEGNTHREAATALGKTPHAVESQIRRLRNRLLKVITGISRLE